MLRLVVLAVDPAAVGAKATPRKAVFGAAVASTTSEKLGVCPLLFSELPVPPRISTSRFPVVAVVVA